MKLPGRLGGFLGAALALAILPLRADEPEVFPLAKGNFWVYEGDVSWVGLNPATNQNQVYQKHLTWRSEITDVETSSIGDKVAEFHGFPTDLVGYDSGTKPGDRLLLRIGTDYYEITDHVPETFQKIRAAAGNWQACFQEIDVAQLFLPTPLAVSKCFGDTPGNYISRRYGWVVASATPFDPASIPGAPKLANATCYSLTCDTSPDHSEMDVVPGLGIVKEIYSHHGTTMETNIHLVQFGHGP